MVRELAANFILKVNNLANSLLKNLCLDGKEKSVINQQKEKQER
jgi:hypothetical protein